MMQLVKLSYAGAGITVDVHSSYLEDGEQQGKSIGQN